MWATVREHDVIVKQLLAAGTDVNIQYEVIVIIIIVDTNVRIVSVYNIGWKASLNLGSRART
jgi:hypothetical protein